MSLADALKAAAARRGGRKPRYRTDDELTAAEHFARDRAAREGRTPPQFETRESIEQRAADLRAAGFEHEADELAAQLPADDAYDDPAAIYARDTAR